MSTLINDTQFDLLSGDVSRFRSFTGIAITGLGTGGRGYVPIFTSNGSGIENSPIFASGQNVGIGTGIPLANLSINGGIAQGTLDVAGTNGGKIRISQAGAIGNGYLGIEYSNPKLGVTRSSSSAFILWYDTSAGHIVLNNTFGGSSNLKLKYGDVDVLDINSSGNVGIGTTSPASKLDVTGNIWASGANFSHLIIASGIVINGRAPTVFNSQGSSGQMAIQSGFLYVCTGSSLWGRVALSPW